ncbi:RNA polymerase I-specific transcription initiation factor RRN3-like [Watersipora subatra]|uniref:RNA polymerase I-specific transcription initiation factor RRN3-like n=1 Tax=Watersipora subatra TaxID=2589382 RepID=UPI00355BA994
MEPDSFTSALEDYARGQHRYIDSIIRQLQAPECKDRYMAEILQRLRNCVSMLVREHYEVVVGAILAIDWTNKSADVIKAYHAFIVNLISAHSIYTPSVLRALVGLFLPRSRGVVPKEGILLGDLEMETRRMREQEMGHVHNVLISILKAVPTAVPMLLEAIKQSCPYVLHKDSSYLEYFIQNILHTSTYCPTIRADALSLVIEKMIYLDVRASRERIEEAESDSEDEEDTELFHMETDLDQSQTNKRRNRLDEADRMDTVMCIFFSYIDKVAKNTDGSLNWEATRKLYLELLKHFEKIILPTYECCHTQYLLFYLVSLKQNLADGFMDYLWKKVKNPNEHQVYRKAAICYLASFIVRAKFVSIRSAADAVSLMCQWIHQYISTVHHNSMHNDVVHHGTFYSVVQAVMYILAFRQREFLDMDKAESFFLGLSLQTIITCKLNPLRIVLPVVARTFSSFVRKHQLAFCDAIMERNNRLIVPTANESGEGQHLESYFPFDPYLLIRSSGKISEIYRMFEGKAIVDMKLEKSSNDEEDEFVKDEMRDCGSYQTKTPVEAFLGSVSPGFNTNSFTLIG